MFFLSLDSTDENELRRAIGNTPNQRLVGAVGSTVYLTMMDSSPITQGGGNVLLPTMFPIHLYGTKRLWTVAEARCSICSRNNELRYLSLVASEASLVH